MPTIFIHPHLLTNEWRTEAIQYERGRLLTSLNLSHISPMEHRMQRSHIRSADLTSSAWNTAFKHNKNLASDDQKQRILVAICMRRFVQTASIWRLLQELSPMEHRDWTDFFLPNFPNADFYISLAFHYCSICGCIVPFRNKFRWNPNGTPRLRRLLAPIVSLMPISTFCLLFTIVRCFLAQPLSRHFAVES